MTFAKHLPSDHGSNALHQDSWTDAATALARGKTGRSRNGGKGASRISQRRPRSFRS